MEQSTQQNEEVVTEVKKDSRLSNAHAILLGAFIIGIAIIISGGQETSQKGTTVTQQEEISLEAATKLEKVRSVSADDHIRGDSDADAVVIVYSDFECPFCRVYHETMQKIFDEYGSSGKVAWIHRQYPIDSLHVNARRIAVASECVAEVAGNDAFWKFTDQIFATTKSNNTMDENAVRNVVTSLGIDSARWNTCMASGAYDQKIADDVQNGVETGGQGTPWSVVISKNGKFPIPGALPYENVKSTIELALKKK